MAFDPEAASSTYVEGTAYSVTAGLKNDNYIGASIKNGWFDWKWEQCLDLKVVWNPVTVPAGTDFKSIGVAVEYSKDGKSEMGPKTSKSVEVGSESGLKRERIVGGYKVQVQPSNAVLFTQANMIRGMAAGLLAADVAGNIAGMLDTNADTSIAIVGGVGAAAGVAGLLGSYLKTSLTTASTLLPGTYQLKAMDAKITAVTEYSVSATAEYSADSTTYEISSEESNIMMSGMGTTIRNPLSVSLTCGGTSLEFAEAGINFESGEISAEAALVEID